MKCSKCKNEMELNFNLYKCYHCSVPAEQRQGETISSKDDEYVKIGGCSCKFLITESKIKFFVINILDTLITVTQDDTRKLGGFLSRCRLIDTYEVIRNDFHLDYRVAIDLLHMNINNVHAHLRGSEIDQLLDMVENFLHLTP